MLTGVAEKAVAMGRLSEAERLLASVIADYNDRLDHLLDFEEWETVAGAYDLLAPVLGKLERMTGKPWMANTRAPGTARLAWTAAKLPGRA